MLLFFQSLVSLVTGGVSGLGRATVKRLIKQGGKVVVCDLQETKGIEMQQEFGDDLVFVHADVSLI